MAAISSHYSHDIEQSLLGLVLQYPELWADLNMLERKDFNPVRQRIFDLIKGQLDLVPQQSVSPLILVEKLKSYGQSEMDVGGADMLTYLEGLANRGRMIEKKEAMPYLKELKKLTMKRDLMAKCDEAKKAVDKAETFDEMTKAVEATLSSVKTDFYGGAETITLFEGYEAELEERGNNPTDTDKLGYMGPFPSINECLGNLSSPSYFVTIGARTGGQKSALGYFWNLYLAEKHGIHVLNLDSNEMTPAQVRDRAMCCMSGGRIPLYAIKTGEWRLNKEWTRLVREIWPRLKKFLHLVHYRNIGDMTGDQVVSMVRRFYFQHVGRTGFLAINLDYIKGMENGTKGREQEYQAIGHYVNKLKGLITNDINACIWTSVQNNKTGIYTGKKASDIVDSEESFSLSDRILQQSSHGFVMRFKVPEEIATERNLFGNIKLTPVKTRELLGRNFEKFLAPVKMASGKYAKNYYNLNTHNFFFEDKGDLRTMMETLGHTKVDLTLNEDDEKMP